MSLGHLVLFTLVVGTAVVALQSWLHRRFIRSWLRENGLQPLSCRFSWWNPERDYCRDKDSAYYNVSYLDVRGTRHVCRMRITLLGTLYVLSDQTDPPYPPPPTP